MRLDTVRVLDLTQLLPGPYATQLLADAGADVVKVEDTGVGDPGREIPPLTDRDVGAVFDMLNRGKRSVAIDLKSEAGTEAFYRLVAGADVVFEQFRPGTVDKLDIDYETVREYNEEIIYCSLTGYGQTGPFADRAGHDLNYVGLAGLVDMTRAEADGDPAIPGYTIGDLGGGLFSAFAIVGALASRELGNTGGEYVDVSMTDVVASFSQVVAHRAFRDENPRPRETPLTGKFPWYDVYECAGGGHVTLAALEPRFWRAFCESIGREDLLGTHGTDDPAELEALREELDAVFAEKPRDEWAATLDDDTMTAPVLTPQEAYDHPQLEARDVVVDGDEDGPLPRLGFPAHGTHRPDAAGTDVPELGEHTDEVLRDAGLTGDEIATLREAGEIA